MSRSLALKDNFIEMKEPKAQEGNQVLFRVTSLYGISNSGMKLPINRSESIETGPVTITLDPDSEKSCNLGIMNLESGRMNVRYGIQVVFPALHQLLAQETEENALLNPPRAVDDGKGFLAQGAVEFLPGSLWSGTKGG
jgi:hypothetical protein